MECKVPMTVLKNLKEFNRERLDAYYDGLVSTDKPNGIACPRCGLELYDTHMVYENPPKIEIWCAGCDFNGRRGI